MLDAIQSIRFLDAVRKPAQRCLECSSRNASRLLAEINGQFWWSSEDWNANRQVASQDFTHRVLDGSKDLTRNLSGDDSCYSVVYNFVHIKTLQEAEFN